MYELSDLIAAFEDGIISKTEVRMLMGLPLVDWRGTDRIPSDYEVLDDADKVAAHETVNAAVNIAFAGHLEAFHKGEGEIPYGDNPASMNQHNLLAAIDERIKEAFATGFLKDQIDSHLKANESAFGSDEELKDWILTAIDSKIVALRDYFDGEAEAHIRAHRTADKEAKDRLNAHANSPSHSKVRQELPISPTGLPIDAF